MAPNQKSLASVSELSITTTDTISGDGQLTVFEFEKNLTYPIKRIFTIYGAPANQIRGHHAHKACVQGLICMSGSVKVTCDDGTKKRIFTLNQPNQLLTIPPGIWASQQYASASTILTVICSHIYDSNDYLRDFNDFLRYRKNGG